MRRRFLSGFGVEVTDPDFLADTSLKRPSSLGDLLPITLAVWGRLFAILRASDLTLVTASSVILSESLYVSHSSPAVSSAS